MDKRGMEMSLNTVIIAVMALLILAVMVYLIGKNIGLFNSGTSCVSEGGRCVETNECSPGDHVTSSSDDPSRPLCKKLSETCCAIVPRD